MTFEDLHLIRESYATNGGTLTMAPIVMLSPLKGVSRLAIVGQIDLVIRRSEQLYHMNGQLRRLIE